MAVDVQNIFSRPKDWNHQQVEIAGLLLLVGPGQTVIAGGVADYDAGVFIEICDDGKLATELYNHLPPGGGGRFVYCEPAVVRGTIAVGVDRVKLHGLTSCHVWRDETITRLL